MFFFAKKKKVFGFRKAKKIGGQHEKTIVYIEQNKKEVSRLGDINKKKKFVVGAIILSYVSAMFDCKNAVRTQSSGAKFTNC